MERGKEKETCSNYIINLIFKKSFQLKIRNKRKDLQLICR